MKMSKRKASVETSPNKSKKPKEDEYAPKNIVDDVVVTTQRFTPRKQAPSTKSAPPSSAVTSGNQNTAIVPKLVAAKVSVSNVPVVVPKISEPIQPYKTTSKAIKGSSMRNILKYTIGLLLVIVAFFGGSFIMKTGNNLMTKAKPKPLLIAPPPKPNNPTTEIITMPVKVVADSAYTLGSFKTSAVEFTNWVLTEHKKQLPNGNKSSPFLDFNKHIDTFDYNKVQSILLKKFRHEIDFFEKSTNQLLKFCSNTSTTWKRYYDIILKKYTSFEEKLLINLPPSIMPFLQTCASKGSSLFDRPITVSNLLFYCIVCHRFIAIVCIIAVIFHVLQLTVSLYTRKELKVRTRSFDNGRDFALPIKLSPASEKRATKKDNEPTTSSSFSAFHGYKATSGDDKETIPIVTDLNEEMFHLVHPDSTSSELDDVSNQQSRQKEHDSISRYITKISKPHKKKATITSPLASPEQSMSLSMSEPAEGSPKRPATPSKLQEIKGAIKNAINNLTPGTPTRKSFSASPSTHKDPPSTPESRHSLSLFSTHKI